ncbi:MAG: septum formation initiator family protein [Bacteroidetes bacterium]|nr:MAG: septum formation initiator family protein [Bacteroidota bacterium]
MKKKKQPVFLSYLGKCRNKYFITALGFIVWLSFFDRNNFITTASYRSQLHKLQSEKEFYETEITRNKEDLIELRTNRANLEKYARERYLMKRDNEEIFVILSTKS